MNSTLPAYSASHLHLTEASLAPGPQPGFPYFEFAEVSPMPLVCACFKWGEGGGGSLFLVSLSVSYFFTFW